jgi:hypothetical protein
MLDTVPMDGQLEMLIGPLYVVEVEDRLSTTLSRRAGTSYAAPPQPLDGARRLVALLLDADEAPDGEGPWRRPRAGGHRVIRLVKTGT